MERLRSCGVFGNVVVVRATASLKAIVDVWGPQPNRSTFESMKKAFDPACTLGAGRGPL